MRGTRMSSQVCSLHRISSFVWRIFTQYVLPCFGNAVVFVLRRTIVYGMCKLPALSVNHAGKHSKDCFRGAVFVDTLAGKLDMWLCMAEPVQVNLSKMELGGNIYLLLLSLHLSVCRVISLSSPHHLYFHLSVCFFFLSFSL